MSSFIFTVSNKILDIYVYIYLFMRLIRGSTKN